MCDEHTEESNVEFFRKQAELSRRGVVAAGAAVATLAACTTTEAQGAAGPMTVAEQEVKITTPDGVCDAHFAAPASGKHPAVLVWPDIMGLRPAFRTMGKRLAESGYSVLTINPFYRKQAGQVFDAATEKFSDPPVRNRLIPLMQSLSADTNKVDAIACIGWLDKQKQVDAKRGVGTTGYCMGGPLVMRSMAYVPDRVRAGATFHGGGIATAQPNSPHLLVPQMKAKAVLCCVAQNDDQTDPESKNRLKEAFAAAHIPAEVEVYPAQHGWCPPDSQVYDQAQAERAWGRLLATFQTALA
jgi:carboxymethylenebutenolidase